MAETIKYRVCYLVPGYVNYYKHRYFKTREAAEEFKTKRISIPIIVPIRSRTKKKTNP